MYGMRGAPGTGGNGVVGAGCGGGPYSSFLNSLIWKPVDNEDRRRVCEDGVVRESLRRCLGRRPPEKLDDRGDGVAPRGKVDVVGEFGECGGVGN